MLPLTRGANHKDGAIRNRNDGCHKNFAPFFHGVRLLALIVARNMHRVMKRVNNSSAAAISSSHSVEQDKFLDDWFAVERREMQIIFANRLGFAM